MSKVVAALVLAVGLVAAAWVQRDRWHMLKLADAPAASVMLMHGITGEVWVCGSAVGGKAQCLRVGAPSPPATPWSW